MNFGKKNKEIEIEKGSLLNYYNLKFYVFFCLIDRMENLSSLRILQLLENVHKIFASNRSVR
jgi:hypothetical protein